MEFKEVIGRRRSIRFFQPYRPVEREKIQIILEAARLASCSVNATFLRAIVVERDKLPRETLDALKTPVSATNLEMAPLHIYFYGDLGAVPRSKGQTLKELVDVGALTASHGWSHQFVDNLVWPAILQQVYGNPATAGVPVAFDCGVAACQALLAAFDEGLGEYLLPYDAVRTAADPDEVLLRGRL